jgi:hypothetical protein
MWGSLARGLPDHGSGGGVLPRAASGAMTAEALAFKREIVARETMAAIE